MDAEFIEKVYKASKIYPIPEIRNLFLKIAEDFYTNNQRVESIFFHLKSLCLSFDSRDFFKYPKLDTQHISAVTKWSDIPAELQQNSKPDKLFDILLNFITNAPGFEDVLNELNEKPVAETKLNIQDEMKKICNICTEELPKEWTLLQITKNYDPTLTISVAEEFLLSAQPIYIIILKHIRSNQYPELISLKLDLSKELYKRFFDIRKNFKPTFSFWVNAPDDPKDHKKQKLFHESVKKFERQIVNAIGLLVDELGPWVKLFSCCAVKSENTLKNFKKVDDFCDKHNLGNNLRILLSLLLVDGQNLFLNDIKKLMPYLNPSADVQLEKNIMDFCMHENFVFNKPLGNPCLLIIDEMLDHFPWEMLKPDEEFYRLSSFDIMKQLYDKFKSKICNGYIQLSIKNCNGLINPENNLLVMEKRLLTVMKYYFPKWNIVNSTIPKSEQLMDLISDEDVFMYCGHGNCMRFIKSNKYLKSLSKSVVFLFGCESTKLKSSSGLHSELHGEHLYFHAGLCPAVIGCNHVAFDFQLDLMSINILTKWIKYDPEKKSFENIDKKQWKNGILKFTDNPDIYNVHQSQSKLGKIISDFRCHADSTSNKITLVYRGLPVVNTNS